MGAVDTTYTFTATDTITSTKMNNIIDQTIMHPDAIIGTTLEVASGKLKIRSSGITSNEMGANSVVTAAITNSNVTQAKLAPNVAGNGPAFRAYANTGTTLPPNVFTKITLDVETFDTNSNFATSRFTPTVAGYYQINATFSTSTPNAIGVVACIRKNGLDYALGSGQTSSAAVRSTVSDLIYFNGSTDYVELFGFHGSTFNISSQTDTDATFMSGCLIRSS